MYQLFSHLKTYFYKLIIILKIQITEKIQNSIKTKEKRVKGLCFGGSNINKLVEMFAILKILMMFLPSSIYIQLQKPRELEKSYSFVSRLFPFYTALTLTHLALLFSYLLLSKYHVWYSQLLLKVRSWWGAFN